MGGRTKGTFAIDDGVPLAPVGTRGKGQHPSAVLRKARDAFDAGEHATLDEAVDAFYEEYSGRRVSDETKLADVDRQTKTKQRMRTKLRSMAPKEAN
jgi:hypothetical protein